MPDYAAPYCRECVELVRISFTRHHDTTTALIEALQQCEARTAALLLVFAAGRHDPAQMLAIVQSMAIGVPTFGGSVVGTVTRDKASYGGYEIAAIAFAPGPDLPQAVVADPCETTDAGIGRSLGNAIAAISNGPNAALMFYTSVADAPARRLHHGTGVLAGLVEGLGAVSADIAGGGLLTDFNFNDSWIITPDGIRKHSAFAIVFPRHLRFETHVLRACCPAGPPMTITAVDGARILSLDGIPALDVLCALLGREPSLDGNVLGLNLCLGRVDSSLAGLNNRTDHVNRVIVSEDIATRSICLLEPDFRVGDQVHFMLRDNDYMLSSAAALSVAPTANVLLSLYIDCAGRASVLTGTLEEEGVVAMSTLPADTPALGLYSGVEIASISQLPLALDLTGVMISVVPR